jgi:hypothetical protein
MNKFKNKSAENFKKSDSSGDTTTSSEAPVLKRNDDLISLVKKNKSLMSLSTTTAEAAKRADGNGGTVAFKSVKSLINEEAATLMVPAPLPPLKKEKKVVVKSIENLAGMKPGTGVAANTTRSSSAELISVKSSQGTNEGANGQRMFSCDYSLVVLIGSFIAYMLASLLSSCFGVFFENMESDLGWSKSKVAFIGGLISALQDLTGPIASALTNRFGCRLTCFFGGIFAALGMIGSAYVHDFWLLGFLMGGVSGFGSSLVHYYYYLSFF